MAVTKAVLVYQAGIANVFSVEAFVNSSERKAERLKQSSFRDCAMYAQGLRAAGVDVRTAACNRAGDIAEADWTSDYDNQPFSESYILVGGVF